MYPASFDYHRPETLQDAVHILDKSEGQAILLAGGQSLIPMMKLRMGEFPEIIDLGRIRDMAHIEQRDQTLHIGAMARHAQVARCDTATEFALLGDVAGGIADKQVRTMGTIGGGLSIADSSGCWPCGLRAMGASVVCTGPEGSRSVHIDNFVLGSYATCLAPNEIVTEIQIPIPTKMHGGAYIAFKRSAAAYPTVAAAILLELEDDNCDKVRLVLNGAGSTTIVSEEAEATLRGSPITKHSLEKAADIIIEASDPPPDARGSTRFKRAMLKSLVIDAGMRALARARGEKVKGGHRYA